MSLKAARARPRGSKAKATASTDVRKTSARIQTLESSRNFGGTLCDFKTALLAPLGYGSYMPAWLRSPNDVAIRKPIDENRIALKFPVDERCRDLATVDHESSGAGGAGRRATRWIFPNSGLATPTRHYVRTTAWRSTLESTAAAPRLPAWSRTKLLCWARRRRAEATSRVMAMRGCGRPYIRRSRMRAPPPGSSHPRLKVPASACRAPAVPKCATWLPG